MFPDAYLHTVLVTSLPGCWRPAFNQDQVLKRSCAVCQKLLAFKLLRLWTLLLESFQYGKASLCPVTCNINLQFFKNDRGRGLFLGNKHTLCMSLVLFLQGGEQLQPLCQMSVERQDRGQKEIRFKGTSRQQRCVTTRLQHLAIANRRKNFKLNYVQVAGIFY